MRSNLLPRAALSLSLTGAVALAHAATFCVGNATDLQTALVTAAGNGEDDTVKIKSGTYAGSAGIAFNYSTGQNNAITISGERKQEHVEEKGSVYRFERTYGAFHREIPLPEGAIADQAKAAFKDGVLAITVPAPPEQVSRGRRLEISRD